MILAVNTGSSSVRLAVFDGGRVVSRVRHEGNLHPEERLRALAVVPDVVVHRVVHGGSKLIKPALIDAQLEAEIEALVPLAALHQPTALLWIRAARQVFPQAKQMAVFDTAFFAALPEAARHYGLPPSLGIRRYGFHGLAHAAMWRALGRKEGRAITLQLGAGCSAAAIRDGRPLDTSMGMTPLEGLVMATRPGDLDPGVRLDDELLNHGAGLLGLSGESADVRVLLQSSSENARLALDVYCRRIKKYIGAYMALLGGIDVIVFSGGVGEHSAPIRAAALSGLTAFGIQLDDDKNRDHQPRIDRGGPVEIRVMASDEEQQMVDELEPSS